MEFKIYKWKYKIWNGKNVSQDDDTMYIDFDLWLLRLIQKWNRME